ncbi:integrin alpha-8 [Diachasma alloeum]|uniref:integrin alpha-8 n=1 Tax=Diachasma alloeum TaxID=454923 RepID=UPI0007383BC5|nr:integrin alpha-8 [Diachasma alloeum]
MLHWTVNFSIILLISCVDIGAYNLDTKSAVVFSDPNAGFYRKGSYFGYAVALYASTSDPLVIVGAPRANVSRLLGIREPGAVYYCRLSGHCKEWPLDNSRNGGLHGIEGIDQMIDESWIGATISVENKPQPRVVVCAPRWKNILWGTPFMNGICYYTIANSSSAFQRPVQKFITELAYPRRQLTSGDFHYNYFAMGQLGFSIHQFSDEPIWDAMVGAPGCYAWTGTPVMISENMPGRLSSQISEKFDENTQLSGYSVTSGFYFDDKRRWYVASAPQTGDLKGKIEIFQYDGNLAFREVKIVKGTQSGEYFGASVTSCDVDNDGRDDLIVGAPSWSMSGDEGRIYMISARKNSNGFDTTWIDGKFEGARFGSSVVCLGDLDHDGYGDVAVGAPYEDKSGAVYIFNGGRYGLSREPSQKILGKDFGRLSGFGIAISEPRDVDGNGYPDVAVGAYRSGHTVLFRAQPVVKVNISLNYVDSARLNSNTTKFSVRFCGYYDGHRAPETLRVKRIFRVDETHHRARLDTHSGNDGAYEFEGVLHNGREVCADIPIILMEGTKTNPIDISASVALVDAPVALDKFRSKIEDAVRLPFDVDCGSDNICFSNLTSEVSTSLGEGNRYIVGGERTVKVFMDVRNHGEPAYETQVHAALPHFLSLANLPSGCEENHLINGSVEVVCGVGNPLRHETRLTLELSMSQVEIESEDYSDSIQVPIHLTTQSTNINHEGGIHNLVINLAINASVDITGKAEESIYSYLDSSGDAKLDVIQFNHIYGVQKLGITPIQQAVLIVLVPTHLRKSKNEVIEIARINATTLKYFDSTNRNDNDYVCKTERIGVNEKKIIARESNNFTQSVDTSLRNRALFLNCDNDAIDCVNVTCLMDVPRESVNPSVIAELKLTIDLLLKDVPDDLTTSEDIIHFVSNGSVMITHPSRASEASGVRAKSTLVGTKFLETPVAAQVTIWIIVVSVLVGILLLALLIFALVKLGFFSRKHKEELEALKADSDEINGIPVETTSSKQSLDRY